MDFIEKIQPLVDLGIKEEQMESIDEPLLHHFLVEFKKILKRSISQLKINPFEDWMLEKHVEDDFKKT
ncbi:hypothetical protein [Atopobacter phocae]|uniref:hypothetical protein n=1 Tax=Atopobacter phocae TaxID=136492 RepID=UPI0004B2426D|nr:hypothetical protein [Atopobacter phocae]